MRKGRVAAIPRRSLPARSLIVGAIISVAAGAAAAAAPPCYGHLNHTYRFEEVCFSLLHNGTGGLSLRSYPAAAASGVTLVAYDASSAITTYQEALMLTAFYVLEFFNSTGNAAGENLEASRTVPILLRPPTPAHDGWRGSMALAPSLWPAGGGKKPPAPKYGTALVPLGMGSPAGPLLVAVQRATSDAVPQPADFDALCAKLEAAVKAQLPGYKVDAASPYTPSHARYYGYLFFEGPFDYECWAGVTKA